MIKIVCDKCGREVYMKNPNLTGRAKIGFEEYDLCKYCILDIKRFINQGKADRKTEPIKIVMPKAHGRKQAFAMIDEIYATADRKTESDSEIPNNSTISKMEQVDEPQTERSE